MNARQPLINRDIDISDDFRAKKRNLIWFSIVIIVLALSDASRSASVKVPTLDIMIPTLAISYGLIICIFYCAWGFYLEARVIWDRNCQAAEPGDFDSIDSRFHSIADEFNDKIKNASSIISNGYWKDFAQPESFHTGGDAMRRHSELLETIQRTCPAPSPLPQDGSRGSFAEEIDKAIWTFVEVSSSFHSYSEEMKFAIHTAQSHNSGAAAFFDEIRLIPSKIKDYGKDLNRISMNIDNRKKALFIYYDLISAILALIFALTFGGLLVFSAISSCQSNGGYIKLGTFCIVKAVKL